MQLESHPGIPLAEHLLGVCRRIKVYCDEVDLSGNLRQTAQLAALTHDLGKATEYFQKHLKGHRVDESLSSHALLSAVLSVLHFADQLPFELQVPLFIAIKGHHSYPSTIKESVNLKHSWDTLEKQAQALPLPEFKNLLQNLGLNIPSSRYILPSFQEFNIRFAYRVDDVARNLSLYFTTNLLLGMLVDADIRAVIGMPANEKIIHIPPDIVDHYIETLPKDSPIAPIREEFYKTVTANIQKIGLEHKLFSLTAPTGIGKTLAGFSSALRLRNLVQNKTGRIPRIIYVLPFTSIIDQNFDVIRKVIEHAKLPQGILLKHHFRSSPSKSAVNANIKDIWNLLEEDQLLKEPDSEKLLKLYETAHNRVETWDAEIIVTTFVRFYETLFTDRRSEMRRLHRLAGSVVILDEVQNIPVQYWKATEESLQFLAEEWDTRFILMTATRPALLQNIPELTEPKKQFFFQKMSRTALHVESEEVPYNEIHHWLLPKIDGTKNFMLVMNTVRSAQEVYHALKEHLKHKLYFLSASLIPVHREKRIEQIQKDLRERENIGLIATQVVEAGVDLDFDVVIRDLAPLDSVVQAAGRCNRNAENEAEGKVFLVKLIDPNNKARQLARYIYDCLLIETSQNMVQSHKVLMENEYLDLIEDYFYKLQEIKAQDEGLLKCLCALNYTEIGMFSLIQDKIPQLPLFIEYDEKASELIRGLKKLEQMPTTTYNDRMKRRNLFKALAPELWGYVVNVPLNVLANLGLCPLPFVSSFLWLPRGHPHFKEIYDHETGFTRKIDHRSFFV